MHTQNFERQSLIKRNRIFLRFGASVICFLFLSLGSAFAQEVKVKEPPRQPGIITPKPAPTIVPVKPKIWQTKRRVQNDQPTPAERSIKTEAKVKIQLCVSEGNVRINGWDRNEIRAFVNGGTKVGFKVLEKNRSTQNPVWVRILGFDPATDREIGLDECLSGEDIDIDVPRGAVVAVDNSRVSEIHIDSVAKTGVELQAGDIFLNNIEAGVKATTYEGDVRVQSSGGSMILGTVNGNILAFDVEPSDVGDSFQAKTQSGAVTLQSIGHRDLDVKSISGTIRYVGEFGSGGRYYFNTSNGSILLGIPGKSSCRIIATYGGAFQSELALTNVVKLPSGPVQKLTGVLGAGDSTLNLTTYSGAIRIIKQQ